MRAVVSLTLVGIKALVDAPLCPLLHQFPTSGQLFGALLPPKPVPVASSLWPPWPVSLPEIWGSLLTVAVSLTVPGSWPVVLSLPPDHSQTSQGSPLPTGESQNCPPPPPPPSQPLWLSRPGSAVLPACSSPISEPLPSAKKASPLSSWFAPIHPSRFALLFPEPLRWLGTPLHTLV